MKKKLKLNKETISSLTSENMHHLNGGEMGNCRVTDGCENNTGGCTDRCASFCTWYNCTSGYCTADCCDTTGLKPTTSRKY